ncbi:MAG: hypothetical protein GXP54_11910 [Deltaproteobacteria bacterium]|nr:hypothetical protein [Deltaproteobacteria bacterium]
MNIFKTISAIFAWVFAWVVFCLPATVLAQNATGQGWREGQEQIQGDTMVVAAYMALWLILLLFVLRIASRQRTLKADILELKKKIQKEEQ